MPIIPPIIILAKDEKLALEKTSVLRKQKIVIGGTKQTLILKILK